MMFILFRILIMTVAWLYFLGCQDNTLKRVEMYPFTGNSAGGLYHTLPEIYGTLNRLQTDYPNKVALYQVGNLTKNRSPIPLVRLKHGETENPKYFLFVAGTHGDEAVVVEAMLYTIKRLIEGAENRPANLILDFIPLHNPDGYAENERTNASGIDLNRNFPFAINLDQYEPETNALVDLINGVTYEASLFFHSANESKYNNLIRCPVEYHKKGLSVLNEIKQADIKRIINLILQGSEKGQPKDKWSVRSDLVDAAGIASDWCVSGFLDKEETGLISKPCTQSHPSLTIEMTFPKQPLETQIIDQEKKEMYQIIYHLAANF